MEPGREELRSTSRYLVDDILLLGLSFFPFSTRLLLFVTLLVGHDESPTNFTSDSTHLLL
jgi:hypothetical protein